jgi:hypothetical protein
MKRRKWKPQQKSLIVLEGLQGRAVGELSGYPTCRPGARSQRIERRTAAGGGPDHPGLCELGNGRGRASSADRGFRAGSGEPARPSGSPDRWATC